MLSEEQRARVCVVLVRARNPNNIGAVARAMHGFGFADLRLVNDYSVGL
jgi:tRNA C32,U32 (ribose-2'-O)-methylase TrmJ